MTCIYYFFVYFITVSDNATAASSMANDSQVIYLHKQCSFNDTKCSNI